MSESMMTLGRAHGAAAGQTGVQFIPSCLCAICTWGGIFLKPGNPRFCELFQATR